MLTLVRVNGGRVVVFRVWVPFGSLQGGFFLFASADDAFQASLDAAEKGGFLRGGFGSSWGGHNRFFR
jgi:hypothetical protein